jgi:hypothetical protein
VAHAAGAHLLRHGNRPAKAQPGARTRCRVASSGAVSHSCVTHTRCSASPSAPTMSVAEGSSEQMRSAHAGAAAAARIAPRSGSCEAGAGAQVTRVGGGTCGVRERDALVREPAPSAHCLCVVTDSKHFMSALASKAGMSNTRRRRQQYRR